MSDAITADDLAVLAQWDTPTICNALEEIVPERRGHGFTTQHLSLIHQHNLRTSGTHGLLQLLPTRIGHNPAVAIASTCAVGFASLQVLH